MGDQLQAIVQRAVVLDVHPLAVGVGNGKQGLGVLTILSCSVDFQLHAKKPRSISVEDGPRFVIVVMDGCIAETALIAAGAVRMFIILIRVLIVGVGNVEQGPAVAAGGVVLIMLSKDVL